MITPSFGLTATERVLPRLALDWTTGLAQPGVDVTRAGVATFVGSNGLIQSATADTQRIDWSTGTAGLLVEEARTNLLLYSQTFENVNWGYSGILGFGSGSIIDAIESPDGTVNAYKIVEDNSNGRHDAYQSRNVTAVAHTYSQFLKAGERTWVKLRLDVAGSFDGAYFDLANGVVGDVDSGYTAKIEPFGDGWYKCSITTTTTATTWAGSVRLATGNGVDSYQGNGTSGIYIWGAQLEAGAFATSYIPTEATAVTRNADVDTMTGTNFSDWFNPTEGTFAATFLTFSSAGPNTIIHAGTNSNFNDRIALLTTPSNFVVANSAGVNQATLGSVSRLNVESTMIGAYKENDFAWAVDGNTPSTDASGVTPSPVAFCLGYRNTASPNLFLNGLLRKVSYWPQRLTNNEVQAFSKG